MSSTHQIHASLDPGLLQEIPRFFGSFEAAIAELMQNAGRAGAGSVEVTYDEDADRLTIRDDGRGLANPELLLRAGRSGWHSAVIDPAGIGFFAHLAYTKYTMVLSRANEVAWTMTFNPQILQGEPAAWTDVNPERCGIKHGTVIEMTLAENVLPPHPGDKTGAMRDLIERARGLQPFKVKFNGDVIDPYWMGTVLFEMDTRVGRVVLVDDLLDRRKRRPVWEHRWIDSAHFGNALHAAIDGRKGQALPRALGDLAWYWFVRPETGVRPKLPGRDELIESEALRRCADALVEEVTAFLQRERPDPDSLPVEIREPGDDVLSRLGNGRIPAGFLKKIWKAYITDVLPEYRLVDDKPIEDYSMWYAEDRIEMDRFGAPYFSRAALAVPSTSVAQTLNHLGIPALYDPNAPLDMVSIKGLRQDDGAPEIALAEGIWVRGVGPIPYLVREVGDDETCLCVGENGNRIAVDTLFVIAGSVGDAVRIVDRWSDTFAGILVLDQILSKRTSDWIDVDGDGDISIRTEDVHQYLVNQIADAFAPSRAKATRHYFELQELCRRTESEIERLREIGRESSPAKSEFLRALRHTRAALKILTTGAQAVRRKSLLPGK